MKTSFIISFLVVNSFMFSQYDVEQNVNFSIQKTLDEIKVFPNPTSEILFIKNGEAIESYHLVSMSGEIVQKGFGSTQVISLIDLPLGRYFLFIGIKDNYRKYNVYKH